jgi:diadenosine tetraphosphatase ApaH/serine/threonine PP2A family protein phosphatase
MTNSFLVPPTSTPSPDQTKIVHHFYSGFSTILNTPDPDPSSIGRSISLPSFTAEDIIQLCECASQYFRSQPIVLTIDCSVHVVGDIHGSFHDLIRIFREHTLVPNYLFLGDYVDRGQFSLESILLLFTLTLNYPGQFNLLRGNHEFRSISANYGFRAELHKIYPDSVFDSFCETFSWMPLAAIIQNRYFCVHGGIGPHIQTIADIEILTRPIVSDSNLLKVEELLWGDPAEDCIKFHSSNRGRGVQFGPLATQQFLTQNSLEKIIRAHECVDGVEQKSRMPVITVFSCSNYDQGIPNRSGVLCIDEEGIMRRFRYHAGEFLLRKSANFTEIADSKSAVGLRLLNRPPPLPTSPIGIPGMNWSSLRSIQNQRIRPVGARMGRFRSSMRSTVSGMVKTLKNCKTSASLESLPNLDNISLD